MHIFTHYFLLYQTLCLIPYSLNTKAKARQGGKERPVPDQTTTVRAPKPRKKKPATHCRRLRTKAFKFAHKLSGSFAYLLYAGQNGLISWLLRQQKKICLADT